MNLLIFIKALYMCLHCRYETEFLEDLTALGCRPPDVLTRVRCGAGEGERVGRQLLRQAPSVRPHVASGSQALAGQCGQSQQA